MTVSNKGQVIIPTGGGKTFVMIKHAQQLCASNRQSIVVVAPRILLAQQLCEDFDAHIDAKVIHCHSGRTRFINTTNSDTINDWHYTNRDYNRIIFTTYHSLHKIVEAGIHIDSIYFDEAHNSTSKQFFYPTAQVVATRAYFFTATPKTSNSSYRGMNNSDVYGDILISVPAQELIKSGAIIPPKVITYETNTHFSRENAHVHHAKTIEDVVDSLPESQASKILVSVPSSRILGNIITKTMLLKELYKQGYDVLHITSKFGAYVNATKVNRTEFFRVLNEWGSDNNKKFVIFHYSILSEGINVSGLTHSILLRNLNVVEMAQTVGRVIRLHKEDSQRIRNGEVAAGCFAMYKKPCGYVTIPVHKSYGKKTHNRIQNVVDAIFNKGIPPLALV